MWNSISRKTTKNQFSKLQILISISSFIRQNFTCTVVNRALPSLHEESLEIMLPVPLIAKFKVFLQNLKFKGSIAWVAYIEGLAFESWISFSKIKIIEKMPLICIELETLDVEFIKRNEYAYQSF